MKKFILFEGHSQTKTNRDHYDLSTLFEFQTVGTTVWKHITTLI